MGLQALYMVQYWIVQLALSVSIGRARESSWGVVLGGQARARDGLGIGIRIAIGVGLGLRLWQVTQAEKCRYRKPA